MAGTIRSTAGLTRQTNVDTSETQAPSAFVLPESAELSLNVDESRIIIASLINTRAEAIIHMKNYLALKHGTGGFSMGLNPPTGEQLVGFIDRLRNDLGLVDAILADTFGYPVDELPSIPGT